MIGKLWYNTIRLTYGAANSGTFGWSAQASFYDNGFCSDNPATGEISTEGKLSTRYYVRDAENTSGVIVALNALVQDLETMGINRSDVNKNLLIQIKNKNSFNDISFNEIPEADIVLLQEYADKNGYIIL